MQNQALLSQLHDILTGTGTSSCPITFYDVEVTEEYAKESFHCKQGHVAKSACDTFGCQWRHVMER